MKRIKLTLTANLQIEFTDREQALKHIENRINKGMVNAPIELHAVGPQEVNS